jgi:hypothetical protein
MPGPAAPTSATVASAKPISFSPGSAPKKCRYLIRLIGHCTESAVEEEIPVTAADAQSGIERQAWVRLGAENRNFSERLRYIWLRGCTGELLHLATNLPPAELSGSDAALLYKNRWPFDRLWTCSKWSTSSVG